MAVICLVTRDTTTKPLLFHPKGERFRAAQNGAAPPSVGRRARMRAGPTALFRVNRSLVVKTLQAFANSHKCRFDVFYDVRLAKCEPTGKPIDMQLDLVAQLNDRFYVFDTKTGVLCIDKWVDRARLFSADQRSRFITCCADEDIPPRLFEPYILIPLGQLETRLMDVLNEDYSPEKGTTEKLRKRLRKAN